MNNKQSKKMRQLARRQYRDTMKALAEQHARLIKPKPKYVPTFVWVWLLGFFIYIKH